MAKDLLHLGGDRSRAVRAGRYRAAQRGDARACAFVGGLGTVGHHLDAAQPRVVELVMARGRAEVPDNGFTTSGKKREADQLVHGPGTDVRAGHVTDVVEVKGEQRPRSDCSSSAFNLSSRLPRRRAMSTRASQSTAFVPLV